MSRISMTPELEDAVAKNSKRKRNIVPENEDDKLEIDVSLPEPPSKKAKRQAKKLSKKPATETVSPVKKADPTVSIAPKDEDNEAAPAAPVRSVHGIWIGNLAFKVTKDMLRQFFRDEGGIDESGITRIHLPGGKNGMNKGFAYIDFTSEAVLALAMAQTEKLVMGRRCLIKNAKSFEGRPEKAAEKTEGAGSSKPPSKRVFVGNLGFDVTKDELSSHFSQAGQVEDLFLASFEDSGKCKGFGWVTFAEIEAAEKAVKGFIFKSAEWDDEDDGDRADAAAGTDDDGDDSKAHAKPKKSKRSSKPRKWFINKLHGRLLRCEFAEDAQTRYTKRFGSRPPKNAEHDAHPQREKEPVPLTKDGEPARRSHRLQKLDRDQRREVRRERFDARKIAPGRALANAPRASGAIVEGSGKKTSFEE